LELVLLVMGVQQLAIVIASYDHRLRFRGPVGMLTAAAAAAVARRGGLPEFQQS
jgi:hypothetical protein